LPLGTDLLKVRYEVLHAAEQEYAVVFPEYYFGQILEARHEPGTVAYSSHLQLELLQETTDEMARNGCKKMVIVNTVAMRICCPSSPSRNWRSRTTMWFM
jgi:creatinine amidohydrolase